MWSENKLRLTLEWGVLLLLTGFAVWLRFYNLGRLGLWGDEGFAYLSVKGILNRGLPELPSGNIYYKNLLYSYLSAIPAWIGGLNEFTVRFVNAFFGVLLVPVFYWVSKKFFPVWLAFLGALILTLNHWEIEFARHARYYCQLQFFYFLALYFFYTGFVQYKKRDQWFAFFSFVLACLSHQLGYTLIFCFAAILWVNGLGQLLRLRLWLFGFLFAAVVAGLQLFEVYFWQVGSVVHKDETKSLLNVLFQGFHLGYFKQFQWLFPKMSWVAAAGGAVFIIRRREPVSFFMTMGLLCLLFMGIGQAHFQPRYVFYLLPLFLLAYLSGLQIVFELVKRMLVRLPLGTNRLIGALTAFFVLLVSADACNPHYSVRLTKHNYGKRLINKFQPSTTFSRRTDFKTAAEYVREHAAPGDLILGMHMIYHAIYAGRLNYWLWSAGPGAWDAYTEKDGVATDRYLGVPLIRNLDQFLSLLKQAPGRVWVLTSPSWSDRGHIQPELAQYLHDNQDKVQFHSRDGHSKAFLFE